MDGEPEGVEGSYGGGGSGGSFAVSFKCLVSLKKESG